MPIPGYAATSQRVGDPRATSAHSGQRRRLCPSFHCVPTARAPPHEHGCGGTGEDYRPAGRSPNGGLIQTGRGISCSPARSAHRKTSVIPFPLSRISQTLASVSPSTPEISTRGLVENAAQDVTRLAARTTSAIQMFEAPISSPPLESSSGVIALRKLERVRILVCVTPVTPTRRLREPSLSSTTALRRGSVPGTCRSRPLRCTRSR